MRNNNSGATVGIEASSKIKRQRVWIDTKVVNMKYRHGHNYAKYGVFQDDAAPDKISIARATSGPNVLHGTSTACFAGLLHTIRSCTKYNRIYSTVYLKEDSKDSALGRNTACITLSSEECRRWIELTKQYQLLPDYIDENCVEMYKEPKPVSNSMYDKHSAVGGGTIILDMSNLVPSLLYVYLSTFRNLREDPGFVRTALYLVDKLNVNFFAAYVFAGYIAMDSSGHHILSAVRRYYTPGPGEPPKHDRDKISAVQADIVWMISLQRYIKNPSEYDTKDLYKAKSSGYSDTRFSCSETISTVSKQRLLLTIDEAFDSDIISAIMSSSDKVAAQHIKEFEEKRPRIVYKEAKSAK